MLGAAAFFVTLPPVTARSIGVPLVLGFLGLLGGLLGRHARPAQARLVGDRHLVRRDRGRRSGSRRRDVESLDAIVTAGLLAATLRFATPLAFAATGGVISERSGVVNIGLEGMMLVGAFFGIYGRGRDGSWVLGIFGAMVAGGLLATIHAVFTITLRADQIVSGFAMNFLALGLTGYLFRSIYGLGGNAGGSAHPGADDARVHPRHPARRGRLREPQRHDLAHVRARLPDVGRPLQDPDRPERAVGRRASARGRHGGDLGLHGPLLRASIISGMLAALGGAYLSFGFGGSFNENMTNGRGFIALAAVILGKWTPFGALGACLLFGFGFALSIPLQGQADISANILSTLPYVITLVALVGVIGRSRPPAAVGRPYVTQ